MISGFESLKDLPEDSASAPIEPWAPDIPEGATVEQALSAAIFQALGSASMCWEDLSNAGVFESDAALVIGNGLLAWLDTVMEFVASKAAGMEE